MYHSEKSRVLAVEQRDKEMLRNNVILYKVPEANAARGEERNKQDVTFCVQLFNNGMHVGLAEEDFINVFRLGRINESGAPRPLMVQLASYNIKNLIMESLYKLRHAEQKYRSVVVTHDMTKTEREECKQVGPLSQAIRAAKI